jgi:hypothetical protein
MEKLEANAFKKLTKFLKIHKLPIVSDDFLNIRWFTEYSLFEEDYTYDNYMNLKFLFPTIPVCKTKSTTRVSYDWAAWNENFFIITQLEIRIYEQVKSGFVLSATFYDTLREIRMSPDHPLGNLVYLADSKETIIKINNEPTKNFSFKLWQFPHNFYYLPERIPRYFFKQTGKETKNFTIFPNLNYVFDLAQQWKKYACRSKISFPKGYEIIHILVSKMNNFKIYKFYFNGNYRLTGKIKN